MRKFPFDSLVYTVHGLELLVTDQGTDDFPELTVETVRGDELLANSIGVAGILLSVADF